jgi:GLPGLI family protein
MHKKMSIKIGWVHTKNIFFVILFFCFSIHCTAQSVEFTGKIEYTFETLLTSGSYKENLQTYNTYFNQTYQCAQQIIKSPNFDSLNKARVDNIAKAYKKYGIEKDSFELAKEKTKLKMQLEETYKKISQVDQTINKFISYNNIISSMPLKVGEDIYCVVDTLVKINWVLLEDTMTIAGLSCQKAKGFFYNQFYEVWFAPSIPFAAGPQLMYGLPGIIVMATSEDKKRRYKMIKIEYPLSKNIQLANCENEKKILWKEYTVLQAKHKIENQKRREELMKTLQ